MEAKSTKQLLEVALAQARHALQQGDEEAVRRHARRATRLDASCEEAWLLLAYVSSPQAGLAYLEQAQYHHPESEAVKEAFEWVRNRLPQGVPVAQTSPVPPVADKGKDKDRKQAADVGELLAGASVRRTSILRDTWRAFRRNKAAVLGLGIVVLSIVFAFFPEPFTPYDPTIVSFRNIREEPGTQFEPEPERLEVCHWLNTPLEPFCSVYIAGSDAVGGDLFSRTVYAARTSLAVAFVASAVSLIIGISYGTIAGYVGGQVDEAMMRFVDFLYSIPVFLIVIGIQSMFSRFWLPEEGAFAILYDLNLRTGGLLFLFIAIGAVNWVGMARLSRAMVHAHKQREYIEAARSLGANDVHIITRHLLPNIIGPLMVMETINIPGYIFLEATLSFIGLGVLISSRGGAQGLNIPSWGVMIREGYSGIRSSPYLVLFPSAALSILTLGFNFLGDGLRDAVDPKQRKNGR